MADDDKKSLSQELKSFIEDTVKSAVEGLKGTGTPPPPSTGGTGTSAGGDVASEVQRQLDRIRRGEERKARDQKIDEELAAIKAKQEKVPVERGRFHKLMGWGDPAE